jgi:hypothetical protein
MFNSLAENISKISNCQKQGGLLFSYALQSDDHTASSSSVTKIASNDKRGGRQQCTSHEPLSLARAEAASADRADVEDLAGYAAMLGVRVSLPFKRTCEHCYIEIVCCGLIQANISPRHDFLLHGQLLLQCVPEWSPHEGLPHCVPGGTLLLLEPQRRQCLSVCRPLV